MLASIRRFAADVVKHAILGEAADPSGDVQNASLGCMVGVSNTGSLLPFLLCGLHQFPFCLEPMTLVITVPPTARKPDVVRALLNLPAQGRIRNVTVAIIGIHFVFV